LLQIGHDRVCRLAAAFLLPLADGGFAPGHELALDAAPRRSGHHGFFDELGERFTLAQHGFNFGPNLGFDADGGEGGRAHRESV